MASQSDSCKPAKKLLATNVSKGTNSGLSFRSLKQYQRTIFFRLTTEDCKLFQTCIRLCEPIGLSSTSTNKCRLTFLLILAAFCVSMTVSNDHAYFIKYGTMLWVVRTPWTLLQLVNGLLAILGAQYYGRAQRWRCFHRSLQRMGSCSRAFGYKSRLKGYQAYGCLAIMLAAQAIYKSYSQYLHYERIAVRDLPFLTVIFVVHVYVCLVNFFTFLTAYCLKERFDAITRKVHIKATTLNYGTKLFLNACLCIADAVLMIGATIVTGVPPTSVQMGQLATQACVLFFVIFQCDAMERSGRKFSEACFKLRGFSGVRNDQLLCLGRLSRRLGPKLSAGGFFIVNRSVILSLLNAFLTYVIVVFQVSEAMGVSFVDYSEMEAIY